LNWVLFSYLKQFSLGTLKIDQDLVHNISDDAKSAAITTVMIQMARSLNLKVIAKGVETAALSFLYQQHCNEIQGYLLSYPLLAEELELLLIKVSSC